MLEAANLVTTVRRGREKLHYLNAAPINEIAERWISQYDHERVRALSDLKRALEDTPMTKPEFVYVTYIRTTPEELWRGLTEPAFTRRYWGLTFDTDWQPGSAMTWEKPGVAQDDPEQVVLEADPYRRLAYGWHAYTPEWNRSIGMSDEVRDAIAAEPRSRVSFTSSRRASREADRRARQLRGRKQNGRDGQRRLAEGPLQPEDAARDRRFPSR